MRIEEQRLARPEDGLLGRLVAFCLQNKFVVVLLLLGVILWGLVVAPFDWDFGWLPRYPVPVDAIPDIGENQQIVFTEWGGRSPQDVEDQITYPLTSALLGVPGVKSVRSFSMFGFSTIYVIFEESVDFYWSRSRVLEKLSALPSGALPPEVRPTLGPDATPLGQVFWYTLEGRDPEGNPTGGWDLQELRSIQDWLVRYQLLAVPGVAEVASVGGFVKEYHIEIDPDAMRAHGVALPQVARAVRNSNQDVGARTMEINRVEYVIRGVGLVKSVSDLEEAVVLARDNVAIRVRDVARVTLGPGLRRGALDKGGAEAVGGVVVVRYGANPLEVIRGVRETIAEFEASLPEKTVTARRPGGEREVRSRVTVVPFYDRTGLIHETLGTLQRALSEEILVTVIVVVILLMHLQSSLLISGLLPVAVLLCFVAMKQFGVDANIVALSGIAIAIGTMVDMGIVLNENILRRLSEAGENESGLRVVYRAAVEVGGAVTTAVLTTVVGFLPVFTMEAAEGKLFKPLAWTKTFALIASLLVAVTLIPPFAHSLFRRRNAGRKWPHWVSGRHIGAKAANGIAVALVAVLLTRHWMPVGLDRGIVRNLAVVVLAIGGLLVFVHLFRRAYGRILKWCLDHKALFLLLPVALVVFGLTIWMGFDRVFGFVPWTVRQLGGREQIVRAWGPWSRVSHRFPGLGKEFMPDLDEGSFLLMPTTMPHASIGEAMDVLRKQDMGLAALPEVETAVGKIGRVESALDPAPISMIETVINYKSEYLADKHGRRRTFRFESGEEDLYRNEQGEAVPAPDGEPYKVAGRYVREDGKLVPDARGKPFRLWRPPMDPALNPGRQAWPGIRSPDDIWQEILRVTEIPGTTSAPKLQPIAARIVMLQSGMRAPMGIKIYGKGRATLDDLERVGLQMERFLKEIPSVKAEAVNAERIVGKPYLEIDIDRVAIARYGVNVRDVQNVIQAAVGGMVVTSTLEGRERYNVVLRYKRELRDTIEALERVLVPAAAMGGRQQVPLKELIKGGKIRYRRGPQVIKGEGGGLVTYVLFDKRPGYAEVDVKEACEEYLLEKRASGELQIPEGVDYKFAGTFENQIRSEKRLRIVLPVALFIIFIILYLQFRSVTTSSLVFTGVFVAWAGGFVMIWLYGQEWFLDFPVFGVELRDLFQMHPINLSVAIWVGFLALFGIATDDGVVMATYLDQTFSAKKPDSVRDIRDAVHDAGLRRVRPCLMTTATTILALLPVLTSTGRGADIMVPMAIPTFGGMVFEFLTMFVVPVLYCAVAELRLRVSGRSPGSPIAAPPDT